MNETFYEFLKLYPKKGNEVDAFKAWLAILRTDKPETIIEGTRRFAEYVRADKVQDQFIPTPWRFLRDRRYLESPTPKQKFKDLPQAGSRRWSANEASEPILSRPAFWWLQPRKLWRPEWKEEEVPK